jgi:hypothetical protein
VTLFQFEKERAGGRVPRQRETRTPSGSFESTSIAAYTQNRSRPIWIAISSTATRDGFVVGGARTSSPTR